MSDLKIKSGKKKISTTTKLENEIDEHRNEVREKERV